MEKNISVIRKKDNSLEMQRFYDGKQLQLIRRTVAKDTTSEEFDMFIEICRRQGLDPFRRQIYALVYNKENPEKRQVSFITGIDGYRAIAKRSGNYRPDNEEPVIEYDEEFICPDTNPKGIYSATVKVWQYAVDGWYPIIGVARWAEFAPVIEEKEWQEVKDKDGNPVLQTEGNWKGKPKKKLVPNGKKELKNQNWIKMPHIMLAKCAEAQALRKGWPEEMGGLYVSEEMQKKDAEVIASEALEAYEEEKRIKAVNGLDSIPFIMSQTEGMEMIKTGAVFDRVVELLEGFQDKTQISFWREQNRVGLQLYWSKCPSDALELKKKIEEMEKSHDQ